MVVGISRVRLNWPCAFFICFLTFSDSKLTFRAVGGRRAVVEQVFTLKLLLLMVLMVTEAAAVSHVYAHVCTCFFASVLVF